MKHSVLAAALSAAVVLSSACSSSTPKELPTEPPAPVTEPEAQAPPLTGPEVITHVAAKYPERLAEGVSHEERLENMAFLRDRIIELGNCRGLTLAWNRKANGLRSIDALNWDDKDKQAIEVVDLAMDYDNTDVPLQLQWAVVSGPAGWEPYPMPPTC